MVEILALGPMNQQKTLLATLVRHANKVQKHFRVFVGDPIEVLGLPDASGEYEAATLGRLLAERRGTTHSDVVIGILDLPLREELFSAADESSQTVVVSLTNIADTLQRTRRTPADYVLVEIAAQLLAIEYRRLVGLRPDPEDCALPWHRETRACVFDYCDNRADTGQKLMEPKLCDHCRAVLGDAHVRQSVMPVCGWFVPRWHRE